VQPTKRYSANRSSGC